MSIVHALVVTGNLLVGILVYVWARSTSSRVDATQAALAGSFLVLAIADLAIAMDGTSSIDQLVTILVLDVLLVGAAITILVRERDQRRRLERERRTLEHERRRLADDLAMQRADRELALQDRLGSQF